MYLISQVANWTIIFIIQVDAQLNTPMYFFVSILALMDIGLTSCSAPKLLANIFSKKKSISFAGCFLQLHFLVSFGNTTLCLLAIKAVDRYIAISKPLHYALLMNKRIQVRLVAGSWLIASVHSTAHSIPASRLFYCESNEIQHYFCDLLPLFKLSCSDTSLNELLLLIETSLFLLTPFFIIVISYILIISAIWKMRTREGRSKAFSTCSSHLFVVVMTYAPLLYIYIRPASIYLLNKDIIISVLYTMGCSLLNPFVYSIRNKEVKRALTKVLNKTVFSFNK
ncbi:olfactory receptor 1f45-like [Pleurodeles waltl]|uniref:olfactory receptor 1f45-like n=1 Tax=Pleurodeles waltl TaxID=8319 RepID=UPI003709B584